MKKSAKGLLAVKKDPFGKFYLKDQVSREEFENDSEMKEIFRDGKFLIETSLSEIRNRVLASIN